MSVVLKDLRETETVVLPVMGAEVELYKGLLFGDVEDIDPDGNKVETGKKMLLRIIKGWNFVDEEGKEIPISGDVIKKLPQEDVAFMVEQSSKHIAQQQKKKDK